MKESEFIEDFGEIAGLYDGLVLDQWGVLHSGDPPPRARIAMLQALSRKGVRLAVLSNSGSSARANADRLAGLGYPAGLWSAVMSSGEATRRILARDYAGRRVFLISRHARAGYLDDLDLVPVDRPDDADFVLLAGIEPGHAIAAYAPLVERLAGAGLAVICANPDMHIFHNGAVTDGPGQLALMLEQAGVDVTWIGKPWAPVYDELFDALGVTGRHRWLAVGDSLANDIAGAVQQGMQSCLVLDGVLARVMDADAPFDELAGRLAAACAQSGGVHPDYIVRRL